MSCEAENKIFREGFFFVELQWQFIEVGKMNAVSLDFSGQCKIFSNQYFQALRSCQFRNFARKFLAFFFIQIIFANDDCRIFWQRFNGFFKVRNFLAISKKNCAARKFFNLK